MRTRRNKWTLLFVVIGMLYMFTASCKKEDAANENNTVTDVDGNVYQTVTIGGQVWMAENLRTTKYNDSTAIPNIILASDWQKNTLGAYCLYGNVSANKDKYGVLYNFGAAISKKLCPKGWHVPTDADWAALNTFLGGESIAGGKLKEMGTTHWTAPNTSADNNTAFTALPGGYRASSGEFEGINNFSIYWSTAYNVGDTERATASSTVWIWIISSNTSSFYKDAYHQNYGFSVRCIKD